MDILYISLIIICIVAFFISLKRKKEKQILLKSIIQQVNSEIDDASNQCFKHHLDEKHYLTHSECQQVIQQYKDLHSQLKRLKKEGVLSQVEHFETAAKLLDFFDHIENQRVEHNRQYCENQLVIHKDFFDSALAYPLDAQQRKSIVNLEDNCLVVSSAGSGKTSTMVGKIRYLVEKLGYNPEDILIITYTNKAAQELSERLFNDKFQCLTFHKLALDIITSTTHSKPSIASEDILLNQFYDLMKNENFIRAVVHYLEKHQSLTKDPFEYPNAASYYADRKKYGIQALYCDKDGHLIFTKSEEEKQICNILTHFGLQFKYEEPYEKPTMTTDYRQYKPDFTIYYKDEEGKERKIYLEHFGINAQGNVPQWFGTKSNERWEKANADYRKGIEWKKQVHSQNRTTLIYTTSAQFQQGNAESSLLKKLEQLRVPIKRRTPAELLELILYRNKSLEESLLKMTTAFISLLKSNRKSLSSVINEAKERKDLRNLFILEHLIAPLYTAYCNTLQKRREIDFTDAIIQATEICNNNQWHPYKYILVDEFQDISIDRYQFLLSLRNSKSKAKLYCVGDDWQSIYRFAGSDMSLFSDFETYFGHTEICKIETSYRFGNPCIEKSSAFIQKNPSQRKKNVKPLIINGKEKNHTQLDFYRYTDKEFLYKQLEELISRINPSESIYILGRYTFDVNILDTVNHSVQFDTQRNKVTVKIANRTIPFLTVHSSKGLEADHVFLLNCNNGTMGFPSTISDDPVLNYVLSKSDKYEYGEERRVFYVAITRAKKHTYVFYDEKKPSPFVLEMIQYQKKSNQELCPVCQDGHKVVIKEGTAQNGRKYVIWGCSNYAASCPYFERKFFNQK